MRLFVAFKTPKVEEDLFAIIEKISDQLRGVRYVSKENLHITAKFLGETSEEKIVKICDFLAGLCKDCKRFSFSIEGVGGFPSKENARVVFFEVVEGGEKMKQIAHSVEKSLSKLGFPEENRFVPHITLGRAKLAPVDLSKLTLNPFHFIREVTGLSLYKSILKPEGPIYEEIASFDFRS